MAEQLSTFSESWYRIANQRIYLRPDVRVRRQNYRGERWYVLENPFSNEFFRLRPAAYEFVARLRPDRTVEQVWQQCVERFPDEAPGQEAAMQLLAQLYHANLLHYEQAIDTSQLFQRFKKRRQRELAARLLNLMFIRFPLLDPDRFLVRTLPFVGKLINPAGALLWVATVAWALKLVFDNFQALREQGQGVLAPENLPLMYAALIFIKTFHEFGHAWFCRKFGGEVHVMGVLLMIFTPVPYMDATSSWGFRSRWRRMLVGGAGMIVELFIAALATFVWARTGTGMLHSLAYNVMFIASVSTIVFNANPLLRFDGYYMLLDLLEIPNLNQRSNQQLRHFCERYLFGVKKSESPASTRREAGWLVFYGIASGIYRVIVFGGVLLLVADRFLILGILMSVICAISWVTVPTGKFVHYLATSPRLDRVRVRAVGVSLALLILLVVLLGFVPFPNHFRAPGVARAQHRTQVVNDVAGVVAEVASPPGAPVVQGQALLKLRNPELELEIANSKAKLAETQAMLLRAMSETNADVRPLESRIASINNRLAKLAADEAALVVRARQNGIWVAPGIQEFVGRMLERGSPLGLLVDPGGFEFVATVQQADADSAFVHPPRGAEVRFRGEAGTRMSVLNWHIVPGGNTILPSPALGWAGGGELPVAQNEPSKTTEAFFEVIAELPATTDVTIINGRSGKIRFDLEPEPLLPRAVRRLFQLLQKRYSL